jgi:hypothetical protein
MAATNQGSSQSAWLRQLGSDELTLTPLSEHAACTCRPVTSQGANRTSPRARGSWLLLEERGGGFRPHSHSQDQPHPIYLITTKAAELFEFLRPGSWVRPRGLQLQ